MTSRGMAGMIALLRPAATLSLFLAVTACAPRPFVQAERTIVNGSAQAQVQQMLARTRQCADLLGGLSPIEGHRGDEALPTVRALTAAGLIERDEAASRRAPGGVAYRPTTAAKPYIEQEQLGGMDTVRLCYAHRQVTRVWLKPHGATEPFPELGYAYRLVSPPAWARRADMQAAFPFLRQALSTEYTSPDFIKFDKGRWSADYLAAALPTAGTKEAFWFGLPPRASATATRP